MIVLDELNKYAPREGHSPLKDMLIDIAQRGRSLGVLLVGAQQTASRVASEVLENAAIRVTGRLDAAEAERAEYGWMLPSTRARARLLKPGTMVVSQPAIPVPLVVTFPFPPWATRKEEVAADADGDPFAGLSADHAPHEDPPHLGLAHRQAARPPRPHGRVRARSSTEVERIADERTVDLVLVSGDMWDRPVPPMDALALGLDTLLRLAAAAARRGGGGQPRLPGAVRGPRAVAPPPRRVHDRRHQASRRRARCWVPMTWACPRSWRASRSCGRDASWTSCATPASWYRAYAERVAGDRRALQRGARGAGGRGRRARSSMAHFMVGGVKVDRAAPRGERELHMGDAYAATAQAIPAGPQYVAMGHIHAPQAVPGAPVPAEYAGSLLALDFGEAGEHKRVVVVDVEPGSLAVPETVPLDGRAPAGPRHRDMGRDRGAGR